MGWFDFFRHLLPFRRNPKSLDKLSGLEYSDALLSNLVLEEKVPGLSVTVVQDGKTLLQKGYGYSNLKKRVPISTNRTLFRAASISKCITGIAFGKMVEEGIFNWDDSFYKYVPYYPKKKHDFSLRQLASHTAGIRGYKRKEYALNKPYSIKESVAIFKEDPLVFEPGRGYLYNSFDFVLLSLAMQEASGIPFEEYVRKKVLSPLDLNNTLTPNEVSLEASREISVSEFYTKHSTGFKKAVNVNNFYKLAGGGYLSTSEDIAKLGQEILNQKLLQSKTYRELLTAQNSKGKSTYYGLGFQVSEDSYGRSFVGHVGSSVGAYSNLFIYPKEEMVISILINCTDPKIQSLLDEVIGTVLEESFV